MSDPFIQLCKEYHVTPNIYMNNLFLSTGDLKPHLVDVIHGYRDLLSEDKYDLIVRLDKYNNVYLSDDYYTSHMDKNNLCIVHLKNETLEKGFNYMGTKLGYYISKILYAYRINYNVQEAINMCADNKFIYNEDLILENYKLREMPDYKYFGHQYETEMSTKLINYLKQKS